MSVENKEVLGFNGIIRAIVRGNYSLQKLRIQMGNRITSNFKSKLGLSSDGMSEAQLEKQEKKILKMLRESYSRITDGIIIEGNNFSENEFVCSARLPKIKKFKGDEIISEYSELVLVDQYMRILENEEKQFELLKSILVGIPIYDSFLSQVDGIGPAMSGVIISEIDIHKAEYPSSLHAYAGLDTVTIGIYVDEKGVEHKVPGREISEFYDDLDNYGKDMYYAGKYLVNFVNVGRNRREECMVKKTYIDRSKNVSIRNSISFNPFLKTKLIGVLGGSFLKAGSTSVDGKKMGAIKRAELAVSVGYDKSYPGTVDEFLESKGYIISKDYSKYGKIYYDYKNRLSNNPVHADKTKKHIHNMAIRYAVKRFLVDLYVAWRTIENLPVAAEYAEAKLGIVHGKAGGGKISPSNHDLNTD